MRYGTQRQRAQGQSRLVKANRARKMRAAVAEGLQPLEQRVLMSTTGLLKEIYAGGNGSSPANFAMANGLVFFTASDSGTGSELWKTNGTAGGTVQVKDIRQGAQGSSPANLTVLGNTLFFTAEDGNAGVELWKTDGTTTTMVADINAAGSSNPSSLVVFNGVLYFAATDGTSGTELWRSDGSPQGTFKFADINATGDGSVGNLTVVGGTLYFTGTNGASGVELFKTDGTTTGIVKNIASGATSSSPANLTAVGNTLFFTANDGTNGRELWKSDGSDLGTSMLANIATAGSSSDPSNLTAVGNTVFFSATDALGSEVWKADLGGASRLADIRTGPTGSNPGNFRALGTTVYFTANNGTANGNELWKTDGTNTSMVADINPGAGDSSPAGLTVFGNRLFFSATGAGGGAELWRTDGTAAGTVGVRDIYPGSSSSGVANLFAGGNRLYFSATDGSTGAELWSLADAGRFEPNDTRAAATAVGAAPGINLRDLQIETGGDVDWYKFDVLRGAGPVLVTMSLSNAAGNLDMDIVDANGNVLYTASGTGDVEARELNLAAGAYYVKVYGATASVTNTYNLSVVAGNGRTARVIYVNDAWTDNDFYATGPGNDANDGLSPAFPKASLQSVLSTYVLGPNDVVVVDTGDYSTGATVTVTGADQGAAWAGSPGARFTYGGTRLEFVDASNNLVYGFTFANGSGTGISARGTGTAWGNNVFRNNAFPGTDVAIKIDGGANNLVEANDIGAGGTTGISVTNGTSATVRGNTVNGRTNGIYAQGLSAAANLSVVIEQNTVIGGQFGIKTDTNTAGADVRNNAVTGAGGKGIYAVSAGSQVRGNSVTNSSVGIEVDGASDVFGNTVAGGTTGIQSDHAGVKVYGNVVHHAATGIAGLGTIGGTSWAAGQANDVYANTTGIDAGAGASVQFNKVHANGTGINAGAAGAIHHNLVYRNSAQGILVAGKAGVSVVNNTVYTAGGDAVRIQGGASGVSLRNNILWTENGYDLYVATDSQAGFASDYNNLYTTAAGKVVYWQRAFTDLLDWQVATGFDAHSIGYTAPNPTLDLPRFANLGADDYHLTSGTSTSIDAGDPASAFGNEPAPNGGRIDLGAYGNTAEASASTAAALKLTYPVFYLDWEATFGRVIQWSARGFSGDVKLELWLEGGGKVTDIATAPASQGSFGWSPSLGGVQGDVNKRYRIRIASVSNGAVSDQSREPFSVPPAGTDYYVDDPSNANDEFTPGAVGNNRNTGKTPNDPKASVRAIVDTYNLQPADVVHIDTGVYNESANLVISGAVGVGDDEGATFTGPTDPNKVATIDRGETKAGTAAFEVNQGDFTTIRNLTLVGGEYGLWVRNSSTNFAGDRISASGAGKDGIRLETDSTNGALSNVTVFNNGRHGLYVGTSLTSLVNSVAYGNADTGLYLDNATQTLVQGNRAYNNAKVGLWVNNPGAGVRPTVTGNVVFGNGTVGIYAQGRGVLVEGNTVYGQTGGDGIKVDDEQEVKGNVVYGNAAGIRATDGGTLVWQNRAYNNSAYGIIAFNSTVRQNVSYSNGVGIRLTGNFNSVAGTVENNLVYANSGGGIQLSGNSTGSSSGVSFVRNNTVFQAAGDAVRVDGASKFVDVRNNILWVTGSSAFSLFVASDSQIGFASDYNILRATGAGTIGSWQGVAAPTLAAWQSASFTDANSINRDPQFVSMAGGDGVVGYNDPVNDGRDDDFHEKSLYGSYKGGSLAPVLNGVTGLPVFLTAVVSNDAVQSPAIDRADPATALVNEAGPNGGYVNVGAYGNTSQASKSPATYLLVTKPDGGESWPQTQTFPIRWRSQDNNGTVTIELYKDGNFVQTIAAGVANTGAFDWTIPNTVAAGGGYRVRVTRSGGAAGESTDPFTVSLPIHTYYVNDAVLAGDVYAAAPGNDANNGLSPATPKASIQAVLNAYNLLPGDVILVDTGTYAVSTNIVLTAAKSGIRIQGPTVNTGTGSVYGAEVLSDGPVGYWRFGEAAGATTAADASGVSGSAAYAGGVTLGVGGALASSSNTSVGLDGVNGHVQLPSGFSNFTGGLTLEAWVYPTENTNWGRIFDLGRGQGADNILFARSGTSNDLVFQIYKGASGGTQVTASGALVPNTWQHVAVTMTAAGQVTIYRNGVAVKTGTVAVPNVIARDKNYVGRSNWASDQYFKGQIDEAAVYTSALAADRILSHYNIGSTNGAILDRGNTTSGSYVFQLQNADDVTLDHLTIRGGQYGIYANSGSDSDRLTVTDSAVYHNSTGGIFLDATNDQATVTQSVLYSNGTDGAYLVGAGAVVTDSTFYGHSGNGLRVTGADAQVTGNSSFTNATGIRTEGARATVSGNTVFGNSQYGVYFSSPTSTAVDAPVAFNNTAYGNTGYGIYAAGNLATVRNNTVYGTVNGAGVGIGTEDVQTVRDNVVYGNKTGINAGGSSVVEGNRVYNNQTGIFEFNSVVRFNRVYSNQTGIYADGDYQTPVGTVANNTVYANSGVGIQVNENAYSLPVRGYVVNNTIYQPAGDGVRVTGSSKSLDVRNNVIVVQGSGAYAVSVAADSQVGYASDYNDLRATGGAKLLLWGAKAYTATADVFLELGLEQRSITADPGLIDVDGADGALGYANGVDAGVDDDFRLAAGSAGVDAGDPGSAYLLEPAPNGGRINLGAEGNTAQATASVGQSVQVLTPNGYEKYEFGQVVPVTVRTTGLSGSGVVALVNAGGATAGAWGTAGSFFVSGGSPNQTVAGAVNVSGVANPAPAAVYQTYDRAANGVGNKLLYQLPAVAGVYSVRLHFVEPVSNEAVGGRKFDVKLNGATAAADYDVRAAAGATLKAVTLTVPVTVVGGQGIALELVNKTSDGAVLSGIEVTQAVNAGTQATGVDLAYSTDGGQSWTPMASNLPLDGRGEVTFPWTIPAVESSRVLVQATAVFPAGSGAIQPPSDISDNLFQIANAGNHYYVNDGDTAGDAFTAAVGDNANSGKSSDRPMRSLEALFAAYDLDAGDVIHVDTGVYASVRNIVIGAQDAGVRIEGPSTGSGAVIDRGNASGGSYAFELQNADDVTFDRLTIRGGQYGIYADAASDSDNVKVTNSTLTANGVSGAYLDTGNDGATFDGDVVSNNGGNGIYLLGNNATVKNSTFTGQTASSAYGARVNGAGAVVTGNTATNNYHGIRTDGARAVVSGNTVSGNSQWGLYVYNPSSAAGDQPAVSGNVAFGNGHGIAALGNGVFVTGNTVYGQGSGTGIDLEDIQVAQNNVVYGNKTGFNVSGGAVVENNRVYGNQTGISEFNATVRYNRVYSNGVGIYADGDYQTSVGLVANNTVYANGTVGIWAHENAYSLPARGQIVNNTVYQTAGDALRLDGGMRGLEVRNNIFVVQSGYAVTVAADSQSSLSFDYNDLRTTGTGKVALWGGKVYTNRSDWALELGFDVHGTSADPQFVNPAGADGVLGYAGGVDGGVDDNFSLAAGSAAIDAGDPQSYFFAEPMPNGGRINLGADGNTAAATQSAAQGVQVISPNGFEKYLVGQQVPVTFRTWGMGATAPLARISTGGSGVLGTGWSPDDYRTVAGNVAQQILQNVDTSAVANPAPQAVYQTYNRASNGAGNAVSYQIPLPAGAYTVRLHFVEPNAAEAVGGRVFDVKLNGAVAKANYDVRAAAGAALKAVDLTLPVTVSGAGGLSLDLVNKTSDGAVISGIEITMPNGLPQATGSDLAVSRNNGGAFTPIASNVPIGVDGYGTFLWTVTGAETTQGLVRATALVAGGPSDVSDGNFLITSAGNSYYVNDAYTVGDAFTTAPGDNANSGKSPDKPMASLAALLAAYDLNPGDTVYVDTGAYDLAKNIVIASDDSGVTIRGATSTGTGTAYVGSVQASGPVAYYRLNEAAGSTDAADASGNNLKGTYAAGVTAGVAGALAGAPDTAAVFDGVNGHVALPGGFANFTGGLTLEAWVYPTGATKYGRIFDLGNGQGSDNIIFGREDTDNDLYFTVYKGAQSGGFVTATGALLPNQWQHVAVTLVPDAVNPNVGVATIYRNGVAVASGTVQVPANLQRTKNYIGRPNWTNEGYFKGSIDEAAVYNKAVTADELRAHYTLGSTSGAVFDRRNASSTSYAFELRNADNVTIDNVAIRGGEYGVYASGTSDSDGFTLTGSSVYGNGTTGVFLDASNDNASLFNVNAFSNGSNGADLRGNAAAVSGGQYYSNGTTGLRVDGADSTVSGVVASNNGTNGVDVRGARTSVTNVQVFGNKVGIYASSPTAGALNRISVTGSTAYGNSSFGIQGAGQGVFIQNNRAYGNGTGIKLDGAQQAQGNVVFGNTATGILADFNGTIDQNRVYKNPVGISAFASLVTANHVYSNDRGILARGDFNTSFGTVSNNVVYANRDDGISVQASSTSSPRDGFVVNNTVYQAVGDAVRVTGGSKGVIVRNNILWVEAGYNLNVAADSQTAFASDYNVLYKGADPNARVGLWNGVGYSTLAAWQAASGQDAHSVNTDPNFVDINGADNVLGYLDAGGGYDGGTDDNFYLNAGSNAIDRGHSWSAPRTDSEGFGRTDVTNVANNGSPDYREVTLGGSQFALGGTALGFRGSNNSFNYAFPNGFTFNFYGTTYTSAYLSTEGFIQFGGNTNANDPNNTTAGLIGNNRIAPLWDDLRTDQTGGDIFVDTSVAGQLRFRWKAVLASTSQPVEFAAVLFADGRVRFDYAGTGNAGLTPTVGISSGSGNAYLVSAYDGATVFTGVNSVEYQLASGYVDIGAYEFHGASNDTTPPALVGITPSGIGVGNGQLVDPPLSQVVLTFSEPVNTIDALASANYELRSPGADGVFDTQDDVTYAISPSYLAGSAVVTLNIAGGALPAGPYRFTVFGSSVSSIHDLSGVALDGDANGTPGGNYVRTFTVNPSVFVGTSGDDDYHVQLDQNGKVQVKRNGVVLARLDPASLQSLTFNTLDGNDRVTVDLIAGNPIPSVGGIVFNAGPGGNDQLVVAGTGVQAGVYTPSGSTNGTGNLLVGGRVVTFTAVEPVTVSGLASLTLVTPNGNDAITIDKPGANLNRISGSSAGQAFSPVTFFNVGRVILDTGLNDSAGSQNDAISISSDGLVATGLTALQVNNGTGSDTLTVTGGAASLDLANNTGLALTVNGGAVAQLAAGVQKVGAITVSGAGSRLKAAATRGVVTATGLTLNSGGGFDLVSSDLLIDYGATNPSNAVAGYVAAGASRGYWNGNNGGLFASAAGNPAGKYLLGLGWADNNAAGMKYASYDGQPIDDTTVIVRYTYYGDANLNGTVSADDVAMLLLAYANPPAPQTAAWMQGDFNYDRRISTDDFSLIAQTLAFKPPPIGAVAASAVATSASVLGRERGAATSPFSSVSASILAEL